MIDFDSLAQDALAAPQPPSAPGGNVVPLRQPKAPDTDYDALASQVAGMQSDLAKTNLLQAQGSDPDKTAQALQISRQTGVPQPAVEENLPAMQQSAQLQKDAQTLDDNPGLQAFVAQNPLAARIAQDDFDKLGPIEKMVTALKSGISEALLSNQQGRLGNAKQLQGLTGQEMPSIDQDIAANRAALSGIPQYGGGAGVVQKVTSFVAGLIDNAARGGSAGAAGGAAAGAGIGALAGGVGALPGAIAGAASGFGTGTFVDMGAVAAGNAYLKMGEMRGADGQSISEAGKQFGAVFTGIATYAISKYAGALEQKLIGGTAESLATRALEEAVTRPTFTQAVKNIGAGALTGAAQGAAVMGTMEGSAIIGEQIAKVLSAGDFVTDPDELVGRMRDAMINGAVLLGGMHTAMKGIGLYGDVAAARRADGQAQMLQNIMQGAEGSKLRERDLQGFQDFMQHQTDGTPVENLYLPAEKVREFYQAMGRDPISEDRNGDPLAFIDDLPKQMQEAEGTGGDVVIPTADFITHLAGTPLAEHFLPDLRVGPDAMSVNEAKAFNDEYQSRVKQAGEEAAKGAEPDSTQKIIDEVRSQATAAGYSDAAASRYGAIFGARYATRGERLGMDPYEAYKEVGPTIQAGDEEPSQAPGNGYRELNQNERGKISFGDGKAVISLFKGADHSTLIHESGHAWLEELAHDANRPDAPQQLKDDLTTVQAWLGHESGDFTTDQHEQFARAAEAYLMEGKAPGHALASVFSRFKQWLTKIYRTVAALDTPINDDIRGVFDRLLATDAELAEATKSAGLEPAFKTREDAGMTAAEWGAYTRSIDRANTQAESALLEKSMAKVRRERTAEYKAEYKEVRTEVARGIDQRPDIRALQYLTRGLMDGVEAPEKFKLNREVVTSLVGKDGLADLPPNILSKDGIHPDEVAEMFGFDSGSDMLRSLSNLDRQRREAQAVDGEKRGIRNYLIDQAADAKMAERKGELLDQDSIREEAIAAVHGERRAELLSIELRYLRRQAAQALINQGKARKEAGAKEPTSGSSAEKTAQWNEATQYATDKALRESVAVTKATLDGIRQHVDQILANQKTEQIGSFGRYLRDERKAGREVQQAILKKDWNAAAAAKQRQILANVLYSHAKDASKEIDRGQKTFERIAGEKSFKTIDQPYTDQMHDLLARFGFDSGRGEELQRGKAKSLEQFVKDKADDGIDLAVDPALFTMQGKPFADMTLGEFRALHEAIDSMREIGRGEKMITIDGVDRELDDVKREITTAIRALGERMKSDFYDPSDAGKMAAAREKLFGLFRGIDASLVKPEALFDQIDKADPLGIMNTSVFRPLKDAQGREDRWQKDASAEMHSAVEAAGKGWKKHLDDVLPDDAALVNPETGRPMKLTRKRMLSMALNWGNEGNRAKLADGYQWSQGAIKAFLDRNMTKADWDFAQRIWGMFDARKADLDELQRRVTGVGLDMVRADAFDTPHGSYDGGYYPIVYDAGKSFEAEAHAEKATDAMFANGYTRATTPKGSTISRVEGVKRPIQLSLDIAPWKIGQTLHDLAFREAIMNADRLLSSDSVKKAFDDVFGPEYRKLLRPWLKHIANSRNIDDAAISWIDKAISTARTNTVIVGIGFRMSTIAKHTMSALSNSVNEVGPLNMLKATKDFYGPGMAEKWKFITDRSADMGFRLNAYDKDVTSQYDKLLGDSRYTAFQKAAQHYGHIAISYLDLGSAAPTWMAAYSKAMADGMEEKDAAYTADKTVRNAHGAQGITDTAAIQRAKGAANLINMFYGFFNHIYNRQRVIAMDASSGVQNLKAGEYKAATKDFAHVLARSFWYVAIPALIEALISKGGPNENKDEGWGEYASKAILAEIPAGIPVLRDIAKAAMEGRDYEGSPIVNAVNNVLRGGAALYHHVADEQDFKPSAGKQIATAAGLATGLPTAAPFTAGKFLWDVNNGDADPRSVTEWIQGLMTGKTSHE